MAKYPQRMKELSNVPMDHWQETVENGVHALHRDFGGVTLTITKLEVPGAWACVLLDGKLVVGELRSPAANAPNRRKI